MRQLTRKIPTLTHARFAHTRQNTKPLNHEQAILFAHLIGEGFIAMAMALYHPIGRKCAAIYISTCVFFFMLSAGQAARKDEITREHNELTASIKEKTAELKNRQYQIIKAEKEYTSQCNEKIKTLQITNAALDEKYSAIEQQAVKSFYPLYKLYLKTIGEAVTTQAFPSEKRKILEEGLDAIQKAQKKLVEEVTVCKKTQELMQESLASWLWFGVVKKYPCEIALSVLAGLFLGFSPDKPAVLARDLFKGLFSNSNTHEKKSSPLYTSPHHPGGKI